MKLLRKLGLAVLYIPVVFVGLVALFLGLGLLELAVNRARGYQLVTLKTRMYWENGKVIASDKVKTWKIAVPNRIILRQSRDAWSVFAFRIPVYSNRREDLETSRYVSTLTQLNPQQEIVAYTPRLDGPEFILTFTNKIPYGTASPNHNPTYYRSPESSSTCISRHQWIDYHGWVVRISPSDLAPERKCAIVSAALDRWTVHIDDLYSKDSGQ